MRNNQIISATNILIFFTIIMYIIQINIPNGSLWLGLNIYFLNNHLYYQLISTIFAHGGVEHIIMNMIVLWQFGNMIEQYIGKIKFLVLYLVGGILTSIGTLGYMYLFHNWVNVVGASGAISVLLGYFALVVPSQRKGMITMILLISFIPLFLGIPIAWYSHLIGFFIGWMIGYLL